MPKLSIITINLNNAIGLRKTLESVLGQTYKDYEYIVIDGGSTDGSVEVIKEFEDKIAYWISEPDKGIYYAMNKGIKVAKGQWIGIINSGDWYEDGALEIVDLAIAANPQAQIIHGGLRIWENEQIFRIQGVHSSFLPYGMIEHPTCFVRKEVYQNLGEFDLRYKYSSDYEFMLRAFTRSIKFHFIDKIIANFPLGGISSTPLARNETKEIMQYYGLIPAKIEPDKSTEIYRAFRHLMALIIPEEIRRPFRALKKN